MAQHSIVFVGSYQSKFEEVSELIAEVRSVDEEAAAKMQQSLDRAFMSMITRLMMTNPEDDGKATVAIAPDFAPGSFSFSVTRDEKVLLNGGIILHGMGENFTATLESKDHPFWSIHT